jgi:hypothetical protein
MAATIAVQESCGARPSAPQSVHRVLVTFDASYPTGGYAFALPAANVGENIVGVIPQPNEANANAKLGRFDYAANKLVLITIAGAEVAAATNLTGQTMILVVQTE